MDSNPPRLAAACRFRSPGHLLLKRLVWVPLIALLVALIPAALVSAQWVDTCVGLYDLIQVNRGASDRGGFHQRTYGDQAETACQAEQQPAATFAWALGGPGGAPPSNAPSDLQVQVKYAGAFITIDSPAGENQPLRGYRWEVEGATTRSGEFRPYGGESSLHIPRLNTGEHVVTIKALNDLGAGPALSRSFTVSDTNGRDPVMQQALDLLATLPGWAEKLASPEVQATTFVFTEVIPGAWATYSFVPNAQGGFTPTVALHPSLRVEKLSALAATLAHEITHVTDDYPTTMEECFKCEIDATIAEASVWWQLSPPLPPQTDFERSKYADFLAWREGVIPSRVRDEYERQCRLFGKDEDEDEDNPPS